jgi:hypothetical protein
VEILLLSLSLASRPAAMRSGILAGTTSHEKCTFGGDGEAGRGGGEWHGLGQDGLCEMGLHN